MIPLLAILSACTGMKNADDTVTPEDSPVDTEPDCPQFEYDAWAEDYADVACVQWYRCSPDTWPDWGDEESTDCREVFLAKLPPVLDECLALDCNTALWAVTENCSLGDWPEVCDEALDITTR
jgi:hypothetical protein